MKRAQVCRCCLSENCYKDISNEYYYEGITEVYSDMLFDTFSLTISYLDDEKRLICEDCIVQLRKAAAFRKQVEQAEETICKLGNDDKVPTIKIEALDRSPKHDLNKELLDHLDEDFKWQDDDILNDEDNEILIKQEIEEVSVPPVKETNIKPKKCSKEQNKHKSTNDKQGMTHLKGVKIKELVKGKESKPKIIRPVVREQDTNRKENTLKLITHSNLCLFDSLKTKFKCFYCKNAYLNITELREHSKTHNDLKKLKTRIYSLRGMSFKNVDISSLSCKLCNLKVNDLVELQNHLIEIHKIEFPDEEHMLIPFKLEEGFQCNICSENFYTFNRLRVHINSHYFNHVCEICGSSYINRMSLRTHVQSMHKLKKCTKCEETFISNYCRAKHMRKVHNQSDIIRYCLLCNKTFRYTYLLNEHKIQEHGEKRLISNCKECGKTFLSPLNLRTHMRSVHINERNHHCSICAKSFFTSCDRKRHERTHQDIRSYACEYCETRFKSKDSLRRHLRRQHTQNLVED